MDLKQWLIDDEGEKNFPYKDIYDNWTIGIGRNLTGNGLSNDEINYLYNNDVIRCQKELLAHSWYTNSPFGVQMALMNMNFNLGITKLLHFTGMINALTNKNYPLAADEALNSLWARELPKRARRIADVIRAGK